MTGFRILSLGWGIQSWGLAAMTALGTLPKVDYAVHADTSWDRRETYEFATRWTPWLEDHGVRVVTVSSQHRKQVADEWGGIFIPAFTRDKLGTKAGLLRRQCTYAWKIRPIRRWLSHELKQHGLAKKPGTVEQWIGITLEEARRAVPCNVQYIKSVHPYLDMLDRPWTRQMVIGWLQETGLEVPVKSSCVFCPYHQDWQWREIQQANNGDWERAIEVDRTIRHKRKGYLCYVHRDRQPLEEHDFTKQARLDQ